MATSKELLSNPYAQAVALGGSVGLGYVALTTLYNHRELTHQSIETKPFLRTVSRVAMATLGVKPRIWAKGPHITHHRMPDANLYPILEVADFLEAQDGGQFTPDIPVPEEFPNLDPVATLNKDMIKKIGSLTRALVEGRYDAPTHYSIDEQARILDTTKPRYFYDPVPTLSKRIRGKNPPAKDAPPARSLASLQKELRDPHSPLLHEQGVWGIVKGDNVPLYKEVAKYHEKLEAEGTDYGKLPGDEIYDKAGLWISAAYLGGMGIMVALRDGSKAPSKEIPKRALLGAGAIVFSEFILRKGGDITNGAGHGGAYSLLRTLYRAVRGLPLQVKPDGTLTANVKQFSRLTFDEVGRQQTHHDFPHLIAYSLKSGFAKVKEATFGALAEALASRSILMNPGRQYDDHITATGTPRPDEKIAAVHLLEQARRETMARKQAANEPEPVSKRTMDVPHKLYKRLLAR